MRDYLGRSKFINIAPRNPTQTYLRRLVKMPGSGLETIFGDAKRDWERMKRDALKTRYSEFFERR